MKRLISALLLIVLIISMFQTISNGQGYNNIDLSYSIYKSYVNDGILGDDVSYEDWKFLVKSSYELERLLSNSHEFYEVYSSTDNSSRTSFSLQKGDVVITNGTSSAGIFGHAGIATSRKSVLHIAGKGTYPEVISLSIWHNKYTFKDTDTWTKVYRHRSKNVAQDAAEWAPRNYFRSYSEYKITSDLTSTHETYCSKIVWQAYSYGPIPSETDNSKKGFRLPYDLPDTIYNLNHEHTYWSY